MAKGKKPPKKLPKRAAAEDELPAEEDVEGEIADIPPSDEDVPPPPRARRVSGKVRKPSQPAQTDKFGIALLAIVILLLIANVVVWDKAGARVDSTMLHRLTQQEYNAQISPAAKIVGYESRGVFAKLPGEVDVVVLDKGTFHGVRKGDVFRTDKIPGGSSQKQFIEFCVFEANESLSRAWIVLGTEWSERGSLRLTESVLVNTDGLKPGSPVSRNWEFQNIRGLVQELAQ